MPPLPSASVSRYELGGARLDACALARSAVILPVVPKGLCNQRLRWVQDIVVAALMGAAVVLPEAIITRQGCHFNAGCYNDYSSSVAFGDAYDIEALTTALMNHSNICVLSAADAAARFRPSPLSLRSRKLLPFPLSTSELLAARESVDKALAGQVWTVAANTSCCTLVVPSSWPAIDLLRSVNAAFVASPAIRAQALRVMNKFLATAHRDFSAPIAIHSACPGRHGPV